MEKKMVDTLKFPVRKNRHTEINEELVVLNFLKSNLSTRQLDKLLGYNPKQSKGWESWNILKKYKLENADRGRLFCFKNNECVAIVKNIMNLGERVDIESLFIDSRPKHLESYRDTFILAPSSGKVYKVLEGEVRNITLSFFTPLKKTIGKCMFVDCNNTNLDTVHFVKSRPEIFMLASEFGHISNSDKYDVYKTMRQYLQLHAKKNSICFLCKKHHQELHVSEKTGGKKLKDFKDKIIK